MPDFKVEFDEFVAEITGTAHAGEPQLTRLRHAITEGLELIGHLVDAIDPQDRDTELQSLKDQAESAARRVVQGLNLGRLARTVLLSVIPTAIPVAVDAIADKSSPVVKFRDEKLIPGLDWTISALQGFRKAISPDAPPAIAAQAQLAGP